MLSRRDKLLIQPWEDRRFKDHRSKVQSALPVIDDRMPACRPHVTLKLKKCQRELERKNKIQSDNFSLLQRLNDIMKVNRLNNWWSKPLPKFQDKVGLFYDSRPLNKGVSARPARGPPSDPPPGPGAANVRCYACDVKKPHYNVVALVPVDIGIINICESDVYGTTLNWNLIKILRDY